MQRYRVNTGLLVGLTVGAVVLGGGIYGLYVLQSGRNAEALLEKAEDARAEGDLRKEKSFLAQYLRKRDDDLEAHVRFATVVADIGELREAEPSDVRNGLAALQNIVRLQPDQHELRRRLIDKLMRNRSKDALYHIEILLKSDPKNTELQVMKLNSLFASAKGREALEYGYKMVGFDKATREFDLSKASAPSESEAYQTLAFTIRDKEGDPELADRFIEQLIAVNPESADAYIARGQYFSRTRRGEQGRADFDKALELDPTNVDALVEQAQLSLSSEPGADEEEVKAGFDKARELLERAKQSDPTDLRIYKQLADIEVANGNTDQAIAHYKAGIEAGDDIYRILDLHFSKASLQLEKDDYEGFEMTLGDLEELRLPSEYIDFLKARRLAKNNEWHKASKEFLRIRSVLSNNRLMSIQLNRYLGNCFMQMGQYDMAMEAYETALQSAPNNPILLGLRDQVRMKLGRKDTSAGSFQLERKIALEARKPEDQQNWKPLFESIDKLTETSKIPPGMGELLKAQIYRQRGMFPEAQGHVTTAMKGNPDSIQVWRMALKVIAADPARGPVESLQKIDKVTEKFGDIPLLRLDKADFLIRLNDDALAEQLLALAEGTDSWTKSQKIQLWEGLAVRFGQIRDQESRMICLNKVIELSPGQLDILLDLFMTAIAENNPDRVVSVQEQIEGQVGSREDPTYLFTEATRLMWDIERGAAEKKDFDKVDKLIERALLKRPDWHMLHQRQGQIALARGDRKAALDAFERALEKGPWNAIILKQHIALLLEQGRYKDALRVLDNVDQAVRQLLLGRTYAEILLNTGDVVAALESAAKIAEAAPDNSAAQLWYGQFSVRASASGALSEQQKKQCRTNAESALAKAVELNPINADAWLVRIRFLLIDKRPEEAEETLRQAQLALPEDQLPMLMAMSFQSLGRWFDAESSFLTQLERKDDLRTTKLLAEFYLSKQYPKDDRREKATPLLNKLLAASGDDLTRSEIETVRWARRKGAELLARDRDYQKLLDAERMLRSNVVDGKLAVDDQLLMARILGSRPEPPSRVKAIRLLEQVQNYRQLEVADEVLLARLYYATGKWDECRQQMMQAVARHPNIPAVRQTYVNLLLNHGEEEDLKAASRQLSRLSKLNKDDPTTQQLIVRVAVRLDRVDDAKKALANLLPRDLSTSTPNQLLNFAGLFAELGDLDRAEALFRVVAQKSASAKILLADFIGSKRDVAKGFEILDELVEEGKLTAALQAGSAIVRAQRETVGDRFDAKLQGWFDKALREDPESISLNMILAGFRDTQELYDDAGKIYRQLLERDDVTGVTRAQALNNLGYLIALSARDQQSAKQAMGYIDEAIDILGPQADILDTRAVAHIALGQYRDAIVDIDLALTENPTSSKFFHKSRAHMLAGESQEAVQAWNKAVDLGLTREEVSPAEQEQFDELKQKVDRLTQSASR